MEPLHSRVISGNTRYYVLNRFKIYEVQHRFCVMATNGSYRNSCLLIIKGYCLRSYVTRGALPKH